MEEGLVAQYNAAKIQTSLGKYIMLLIKIQTSLGKQDHALD